MLRPFLAAALFAGCAASTPTAEAPDTPGASATGTSETESPATEAPSEPGVAIGEPIRLAAGDAATLGGVPVRFVAVTEDSRCPEGATCVWQGRARVRLAVGATEGEATVPNGLDEDDTVSSDDARIRVVALHPYPGSAEAEAGAPVEVEIVAEPLGE